jgi:hypothetical protein
MTRAESSGGLRRSRTGKKKAKGANICVARTESIEGERGTREK